VVQAARDDADGRWGTVVDDRRQQLLDEAADARGAVLALVEGLSQADFARPTANAGWSVKDEIAHLASIEARIRLMLAAVLSGRAWSADRAELDAFNAGCVEERRTWTAEAVIAELRTTGQETATLLAQLTPEQLDQQWDHPIFGPMTVERTAGIIARHLRSHAEELRAALRH
jgi:uncharacterized protein (TIGR03083 family)